MRQIAGRCESTQRPAPSAQHGEPVDRRRDAPAVAQECARGGVPGVHPRDRGQRRHQRRDRRLAAGPGDQVPAGQQRHVARRRRRGRETLGRLPRERPLAPGDQHPAVGQTGGAVQAAHDRDGRQEVGLSPAGGEVELGRRLGQRGRVQPPDDEHAAARQERGAVSPAGPVERREGRERVRRRVVDLHLGQGLEVGRPAAADEHAAVVQRDGGVLLARHGHRTGGREGAGGGVVDLGGCGGAVGTLAAGDQHPAVGQAGGAVTGPAHRHRAGRAEAVAGGVVDLGAGQLRPRAASDAPRDEHAAVVQQGGRVQCARPPQRAGRHEHPAAGIEPLRRVNRLVGLAVAPGDQHRAVVEQRGRVAAAGQAHGVRILEDAGIRHEQLGGRCVQQPVLQGAATDQHAPVGQGRGLMGEAGSEQVGQHIELRRQLSAGRSRRDQRPRQPPSAARRRAGRSRSTPGGPMGGGETSRIPSRRPC